MNIRRMEIPHDSGEFLIMDIGDAPVEVVCPGIDKGVVPLVSALVDAGYVPYASCEGGEGHSSQWPWVRVRHEDWGLEETARRLRMTLLSMGVRNFTVRVELRVNRPAVYTSWVECILYNATEHQQSVERAMSGGSDGCGGAAS